jgi:septum formation protein
MSLPVIYLASASPRRSQLLEQIGVAHRVMPVDIDESVRAGERPADYVVRLAGQKAEALWARLPAHDRAAAAILGSDTTVTLDGQIFGKPSDRADGLAMLRRLSGRTHQVLTAVALCVGTPANAASCEVRLSESEVTFGTLSDLDIEGYWSTGEPLGKAGGYAVQGRAAAFIVRIAGSYSGIMGLPLADTAELLHKIGWRLGADDQDRH